MNTYTRQHTSRKQAATIRMREKRKSHTESNEHKRNMTLVGCWEDNGCVRSLKA